MLLAVPRHCLGIISSSKGLVHGHLYIRQAGQANWTECQSAQPIPGDQAAIQAFEFFTEAR